MTRAMRRIAHEVIEKNRGVDDLIVVGIRTRGGPLAERLAALLTEIEGVEVQSGIVDIGMYRDDIDTRPRIELGPTELAAVDLRTRPCEKSGLPHGVLGPVRVLSAVAATLPFDSSTRS